MNAIQLGIVFVVRRDQAAYLRQPNVRPVTAQTAQPRKNVSIAPWPGDAADVRGMLLQAGNAKPRDIGRGFTGSPHRCGLISSRYRNVCRRIGTGVSVKS